MNKSIWVTILIIIIIIIAAVFLFQDKSDDSVDTATTTAEDLMRDSESITIGSPQNGQRVGTPIVIEGELLSQVPDNTVYYRLKSAGGESLSQGYVSVATGTEQTGSFRGELIYASEAEGNGVVEIYTKATDGTETVLRTIPVMYTETPEFIKG